MGNSIKVLMLVSNNLSHDARVRKEAQTVAEAGFELTVIGVGAEIPADLKDAPYQLILSSPQLLHLKNGKSLMPRWGRESVWYPLRVAVNLTVAPRRMRRWNTECTEDSPFTAAVGRPDMESLGVEQDPDIVHCHDLDTLWAGYRIAQRCGARLVYDSHEIYLALPYLREEDREQYAQIEAQVFPHLDALISVSPAIGQVLVRRYESDLTPVTLYNGGATVASSVTTVSSPVKLFFQGLFASTRNNVELIYAMQQLRGKATLTLQGWGSDEDELRDAIKEGALEDVVTIIPPVAPLEVVESANHYDVGIINIIPTNENLVYALPNKFFDYMCGGLAIASTSLLSIKEIIDKAGCGITYEPKGVEHTAQALDELISDPQRIRRMKEASLASAPQYAWPAQTKKLVMLYEKLTLKINADVVD